jgi:hypothetical protein
VFVVAIGLGAAEVSLARFSRHSALARYLYLSLSTTKQSRDLERQGSSCWPTMVSCGCGCNLFGFNLAQFGAGGQLRAQNLLLADYGAANNNENSNDDGGDNNNDNNNGNNSNNDKVTN